MEHWILSCGPRVKSWFYQPFLCVSLDGHDISELHFLSFKIWGLGRIHSMVTSTAKVPGFKIEVMVWESHLERSGGGSLDANQITKEEM